MITSTTEESARELESKARPIPFWPTLALLFLLLAAYSLRVAGIEAQSLWLDEGLSFYRASSDVGTILVGRIDFRGEVTTDQHPPLYFLLLHGALTAFGDSELALRFPSMAFIVLAVALSYALGTKLVGRGTGIATAFVASTSPYYLYYAQEARPYALVIMLTTLSIYLLLVIARGGKMWAYLAFGASCLALVTTHYLTIFLVSIEVAALAVSVGILSWRRIAFFFTSALVILVIGLPIERYFFERYLLEGGGKLEAGIEQVARDLAVSFSFGITVDQFLVAPYAAGIALTIAVAIFSLVMASRKRTLAVVPALLCVPPVILYIISQYKGIYNTRYTAFLAPPYYLLLGIGISYVCHRNRLLGALFYVYFAGVSLFGIYDYFFVHNTVKQDYRAVVEYMLDRLKPGDALVINNKAVSPALEYYTRGVLPWYSIPAGSGLANFDVVDREVRQIARQHDRIWLVVSMSDKVDPVGMTAKTLERDYSKVDEKVFVGSTYGIGLQLFSAKPYAVKQVPVEAVKADVSFDGKLRLLGYELHRDPNALESRMNLVLYWQPEEPLPVRYAVLARLVDDEGQTWGAQDGEPYKGIYPTFRWKTGDIVRDERTILTMPGAPPGRYTLQIGIREVDSRRPLKIRSEGTGGTSDFASVAEVNLASSTWASRRNELVVSRRFDAVFLDAVELVGTDVQTADKTPGEEIGFRLFWRALGKVKERLRAEMRWIDKYGVVRATTSLPVSTRYSSDAWQPGDLVGAHYRLVVPQVEGGYYDLALSLKREDDDAAIPSTQLGVFQKESASLARMFIKDVPRLFSAPSLQKAIDSRLENTALLLGYNISSPWTVDGSGDTLRIRRVGNEGADSLGIELLWQSVAPTETSFKVFVQLIDGHGKLVAQHDGFPQGGSRPTTGWVSGEVVADKHNIQGLNKLAPGEYPLIVGLYEEASGRRLRLPDGGDFVHLGGLIQE
ncbi:MAG: glycosyltransferase family 39 protein [Chloroflexi bacterium]|nr:glycosyltransferase family 39 protein [Chloroflexota bacterium]